MNEQSAPQSEPVESASKVVAAFAARPDTTADQIVNLAERLLNVFSMSPEAMPRTASETVNTDLAAAGTQIAVPAVPLDEAVSNDKVYCLCCGRGFTMLKRHLKSEHGLTDDEYRKMFSLPEGMPLVAPMYSKRKASFAKKVGLGKYHRSENDPAGAPSN